MVENIVFCFNQTINTLAQTKDGAIIIHWTLEEWLLTLSERVSLIEVSHKGKNSHLTYPQNSQLDPNLQYHTYRGTK